MVGDRGGGTLRQLRGRENARKQREKGANGTQMRQLQLQLRTADLADTRIGPAHADAADASEPTFQFFLLFDPRIREIRGRLLLRCSQYPRKSAWFPR